MILQDTLVFGGSRPEALCSRVFTIEGNVGPSDQSTVI